VGGRERKKQTWGGIGKKELLPGRNMSRLRKKNKNLLLFSKKVQKGTLSGLKKPKKKGCPGREYTSKKRKK